MVGLHHIRVRCFSPSAYYCSPALERSPRRGWRSQPQPVLVAVRDSATPQNTVYWSPIPGVSWYRHLRGMRPDGSDSTLLTSNVPYWIVVGNGGYDDDNNIQNQTAYYYQVTPVTRGQEGTLQGGDRHHPWGRAPEPPAFVSASASARGITVELVSKSGRHASYNSTAALQRKRSALPRRGRGDFVYRCRSEPSAAYSMNRVRQRRRAGPLEQTGRGRSGPRLPRRPTSQPLRRLAGGKPDTQMTMVGRPRSALVQRLSLRPSDPGT